MPCRFSLNDKLSDIMASFRGKMALMGLFKKVMANMGKSKEKSGFEMTPDMMQMMGSFTILRLTGLVSMVGVEFTKEELLKLNAKLNKIKKK